MANPQSRYVGKRVKVLGGPAGRDYPIHATCTSLVGEACPMIRLTLDDGTTDYWAHPHNVTVVG